MKTETKAKIVAYIKQNREVTAKELKNYLGISYTALYKQLNKLLVENAIKKSGRPPKVFYGAAPEIKEESALAPAVWSKVKKIIGERFAFVSPDGRWLEGLVGFMEWCARHNLPAAKTAGEYAATLKKYDGHKINNFISGWEKFQRTFAEVYLDEVYYLDFYSVERFGKTKLGALILAAKQSQEMALMEKVAALAEPGVNKLIKDKKIDAVGFIPPTLRRAVQLQKELPRLLGISLPTLNIVKASAEIAVAQKSLASLADRIENARRTIFIGDKRVFNNVLLIDDAVGSGATLNETAKKIKEKKLAKNVIGLGLVGSYKGFDVISEI